MSRLTEQNIRGSRLKKGEIALHDNFESGNRPYKAFQMAKENYIDTKATPKNTYVYEGNSLFTLTSWHTTIRSCGYDRNESITDDSGKVYYRITTDNDLSLCKNYSENGDSDKGLWRAPNQKRNADNVHTEQEITCKYHITNNLEIHHNRLFRP